MRGVGGLRRCLALVAGVIVLASGLSATGWLAVPGVADALPSTTPDSTWVPNGRVQAIEQIGDRIYLGGQFNMVGPPVPHMAMTNRTTGDVTGPPLDVTGTVSAIVPDGAGGWYVGGTFTVINGVARRNAARIASDGTVLTWNPDLNFGVETITLTLTRVVLGGSFTKSRSSSRLHLVAVDFVNGAADGSWRADTDGNVTTVALAPDGLRLMVGGTFTSINGVGRRNAAAISVTTGAVDPSFNPNPNGEVTSFAFDGTSRTYIGGRFTLIGLVSRQHVAAVDSISGLAELSWSVTVNGAVLSMATSNDGFRLFLGGTFTKVKNVARNNAAAVTRSAALHAWTANPNGAVNVIKADPANAVVFLGGQFTAVRATALNRAAFVDITTGAPKPAYDVDANDRVVAADISATGVLLGGDFSSLGAVAQKNLAVIDATTGALAVDQPVQPNAQVYDILLSPDEQALYVSGDFTSIGGTERTGAAMLNPLTGALRPVFNPKLDGQGRVMAIKGNDLYIGGAFSKSGTLPVKRLGRFNPDTGVADGGWLPLPDAPIFSLAVSNDGTRVYAGGAFRKIGLTARKYFAEINAASALATGWDPAPGFRVLALLLDESENAIYFGLGDSDTGSGNQVDRWTIGGPRQWRDTSNGNVQALALSADKQTLYVAGHHVTVSLPPGSVTNRPSLYAVSPVDGSLVDFDANIDDRLNGVWALNVRPDALLVGGEFWRVGTQGIEGFARFSGTP
jgi:trimeric autotransporter adhesin